MSDTRKAAEQAIRTAIMNQSPIKVKDSPEDAVSIAPMIIGLLLAFGVLGSAITAILL
jgi:hypothetical protein